MSQLRFAVLIISAGLLASCSKPQQESAASLQASAAARIQAIPPASPEKYRGQRDMRGWRNPYLIVRTDGIGVLDAANHEQRLIKPDELPQALAQLPGSSWPYGRVVAVAENGVAGSENDRIQIRKNRALVAGTLQSMQVLINWVPSS